MTSGISTVAHASKKRRRRWLEDQEAEDFIPAPRKSWKEWLDSWNPSQDNVLQDMTKALVGESPNNNYVNPDL